MGMILWTVFILGLGLKINHDEARAHEPPAQNTVVTDSARVTQPDTASVKDSIRADTGRTVPR